MYFNWFPGGDSDLFVISADGSAESETLVKRPFDQYPVDASLDDRLLVFEEIHPETGYDLYILPLDGDEPFPFVTTTANERDAAFSPDSRFLAYSSDETGREEIYVQAISGEGGKLLVSVDGGIWPRWSPSGNELFYRQGTVMMAVSVKLNPTFRPGIPRELFNGNYPERFDVFPDGDFANGNACRRRFARARNCRELVRRAEAARPNQLGHERTDRTTGLTHQSSVTDPLMVNGGADETRTRDLRRDRPAF